MVALAWLMGLAILSLLSLVFALALIGEVTGAERLAWFLEAIGTSAAGPLGHFTSLLTGEGVTWWPWGPAVLCSALVPWIGITLIARRNPKPETAMIVFFLSFLWHAWGFAMMWLQGG